MQCPQCLREMTDPGTESCLYDVIMVDEIYYERSRHHFGEQTGRCGDCQIKHGQVHHPGCDVERCPQCGRQLISCGCFPEDASGLFVKSELEGQEEIKAPTEPVGLGGGL